MSPEKKAYRQKLKDAVKIMNFETDLINTVEKLKIIEKNSNLLLFSDIDIDIGIPESIIPHELKTLCYN